MTLPWTRLIQRNINNRSFHTSKCVPLFWETPDKDGYYQKPEEQINWEKLSFKTRMIAQCKIFQIGIKEWFSELIGNAIRGPRIFVYPHKVDVIWRFKGDKKELQEWVITTDKDNNLGFSTAQLDFTRQSKGLFHGFIDTKVPPNGEIKRTGYCNIKMVPPVGPFMSKKPYDWELFTHLVLRVRGDGRVYAVNLHTPRNFDILTYDTYHYFIWTRGGPYWEYIRIPFSKFFFAYKGRIQAKNPPLPRSDISTISFTLADKITGPFRLEIDFIGVEYDPSHIEESAYETYVFDQKFW